MAAIGSPTVPVYFDANGIAKTCTIFPKPSSQNIKNLTLGETYTTECDCYCIFSVGFEGVDFDNGTSNVKIEVSDAETDNFATLVHSHVFDGPKTSAAETLWIVKDLPFPLKKGSKYRISINEPDQAKPNVVSVSIYEFY